MLVASLLLVSVNVLGVNHVNKYSGCYCINQHILNIYICIVKTMQQQQHRKYVKPRLHVYNHENDLFHF